MKNILLSTLLLSSCGPQKNSESNTKIVGHDVHSRPHMISTASAVSIVKNGIASCGGVIIDYRTVLTAAHCADYDGQEIDVYIGEYAKHGIHRRGKFIIHPDYELTDRYTIDGEITVLGLNDIAILELNKPVRQTSDIKYATLPTSRPKYGDRVEVFGYGKGGELNNDGTIRTDSDSEEFGVSLKYLIADIIGHARLGSSYLHYENENKDKFLDAQKIYSYKATNGNYTCAGDSGGGVFRQRELVAIHIGGSDKIVNRRVVADCEEGISYGVNVYDYLPWIKYRENERDNTTGLVIERKKPDEKNGQIDSEFVSKQFKIINRSNDSVVELYAAPDYAPNLGYNILFNNPLKPRNRHVMTITDRSCNYVFKIVRDSGHTSRMKGNICNFSKINVD